MQTLTLFVSSPGDVRDERQAIGRIVERLQARYWNFLRLEPVLWEKEPLRATAHFNEELIRPSDCDLFVCVLWSRLGSPLPSQFNRADGTRFDSGTEWELVEATDAFEARAGKALPAPEAVEPTAPPAKKQGRTRKGAAPAKTTEPTDLPSPAASTGTGDKPHPDILVYRRMSEPPAASDPEQEPARQAQRTALDKFCRSFFFNPDGTIRRAFSPYEKLDEFETLFEQHLEKLLLRHIRLQRGLAEEAVRPLPVIGSPFKGLGAFDFTDAPLFFGRNRAIAEALDQLKKNRAAGHAFLLIYGGSGYGKSSLMRAGLAPRLTAEGYLPEVGLWRRALFTPVTDGSPAVETLARALGEALPELGKMTWDSAKLTRMLGEPGSVALTLAAVVGALDRVSAARPAQLLVMIDQLEEIFTAGTIAAEDRDAFFNILAAMAMSRRIWVVATMRSEFFPRVPEHRDLYQLVRHGGGFILAPPELPELHQIIRYPALAAGLQFERHSESGRDLSEQIYQDAAEAQDALPLLEFTLEELYQRRRDNLLTWSAYDELGGLAGAIARRAQEVFEALPLETRREAARHLFGELVTVDLLKNGPATRRRAKRALLEKAHPGAPGFIAAFVDAKLLVTASEDQTATVTLAHEALITHWPVLNQWIADHRDLLLARRRLEEATRLWVEGRKAPKLLLSEGRLAEAQRVSEAGIFQLGAEEEELVRVSTQRARRKLRVFQGATVLFAGLAVAAGGLGWVARQRGTVSEQRRIQATTAEAATRQTLAAADFDAGAQKVENGAPDEALPYLLSALEGDPKNLDAQALLLGTLSQTSWHFPVARLKHPQPVRMLSFGAADQSLYSGTDRGGSAESFNTVLRWDLKDLSIQGMLRPVWSQGMQMLSISPDGKHAVIQRGYHSPDETLLCNAETMEVITRLGDAALILQPATCFSWSPDGLLLGYLAINDDKETVWRICDVASGAPVRDSLPDSQTSGWMASSLSRTELRAVAEDGTVMEMPLNPAKPIRTGHLSSSLDFAVFSPDGSRVLSAVPGDGSRHWVTSIAGSDSDPAALETTSLDLATESAWTDGEALTDRFPWWEGDSAFWDKLMPGAIPGELVDPLKVDGTRLEMTGGSFPGVVPKAPVHEDSQILSSASRGNVTAVGTAAGMLTLHEWLPPFLAPPLRARTHENAPDAKNITQDGWTRLRQTAAGELQRQGNDWRLEKKDHRIVRLASYAGWDHPTAVAVNAKGDCVVLAGYSSGSGGYSSSGMMRVSPETGEALSDIEPVNEIRAIDFLGGSNAIAAIGSTEVIVAELTKDGFRRTGAIPVVNAISLKYLEGRKALAIAGTKEIELFDAGNFSKVATLPVQGGRATDDWEDGEVAWAEDEEHGWLAYARDEVLHVWSFRNGRLIVPFRALSKTPEQLRFETRGGMTGLAGDGGELFVPLARTAGLTADEAGSLKALAEALGGVRFAANSRALEYLAPDQRKARAAAVSAGALSGLLPESPVKQTLDRIRAIEVRESSPAAWAQVWERLDFSDAADDQQIARLAADLGPENPWYRAYLSGLIGDSQSRFHRWARGADPESVPPALPEDESLPQLLRLKGESVDRIALLRAAWLVQRTVPGRIGPELTLAEEGEEKVADEEAIRQLQPEAIARLKAALLSGEINSPWKLALLTDLEARPAALELLKNHAEKTLASFDAAPSPAAAVAHAEALELQGDVKGAEAFLTGKIPGDATLTLDEAHFLIASELAETCRPQVAAAVAKLGSPWLWSAWMDFIAARDSAGLAEVVKQAMEANQQHGPVAVHAVRLALAAKDSEALSVVLQQAQGMPSALREYLAGRALWMQGKQAEVFSMWPKEYPNLADLSQTSDWHGWEAVIAGDEAKDFFAELDAQLSALYVQPDMSVEQQRELAKKLLAPETLTTYGGRRVRDALLELALSLSYDKASHGPVLKMIEQARMAGADPIQSLRAEARALAANGEPSAAYSRYLQILDAPENGLIWQDCVEAAQCLILDGQDAAVVELLLKGKSLFPQDATYAYQAAWLLLTSGHPEESGILLDYGFALPFDQEQMPTALAMLICAAEKTQRTERANDAFADLLNLDPSWAKPEAAVQQLSWPPDLKKVLLAVAKRKK